MDRNETQGPLSGVRIVEAGAWRVELVGGEGRRTLLVDDADRAVRPAPPPAEPPSTPRRAMRELHEGHGHPVWTWLVALTGLLPVLTAVTGTLYWIKLQRRKARA